MRTNDALVASLHGFNAFTVRMVLADDSRRQYQSEPHNNKSIHPFKPRGRSNTCHSVGTRIHRPKSLAVMMANEKRRVEGMKATRRKHTLSS